MTLIRKSSDSTDQQFAVLAYGSLLAHPGDWIGSRMQRIIRWHTPFGVEYLGISQRRGGAPTLVRSDHHKPVKGGLIVLAATETNGGKDKITLAELRQKLAEREGTQNLDNIKTGTLLQFKIVYSDFHVHDGKRQAVQLAEAAIRSVATCVANHCPFLNGVRYLNENLEWGVVTDMTEAYHYEILRQTGANDLNAAEAQLLREASSK